MSPSQRRRSDRDGHSGDRYARIGRRSRGQYFRTAVEWLEPRCMLSAQGLMPTAYTTVVLANPSGAGAAATGSSSPPSSAYTPTQILNAYGFNQVTFSNGTVQGNGAGQTIALIDAYNDPNIAGPTGDLATFDAEFGLPAPPNFTVEGQTGSTSQLPGTPTVGSTDDWSLEISLDVEWAHALAPAANILLVEANSSGLSDLFTAATTAANTPGVVVVSMSFGASEFSGETSEDSTFTTPSGHLGGAATTGGTELAGGVTFVASAGDSGSPGGYPAYSPNVLSVGGTTLNLSSGNYSSETVWDNSSTSATGGGISSYESQPAYQEAVVPSADSNGGTDRAMPDVAFDANPNTGAAVADSFDYGTGTAWVKVGGTSFGAPAWAAIVAIADQGRAIDGLGSLDSSSQTLPEIYAMPSTNFHDITSGSNGTYSATAGYDLVTGRGTPIVSSVVGSLDAFSVTATTPVVGSTMQGALTSFTVTFSDAYATSGLAASDFEVNGVAATSFTQTSATEITFSFSASPVLSNQLSQTMTIAAGAIDRAADVSPLVAFAGTFNDTVAQIAVVSTTPAAESTVDVPMTSLTVQFSEAYAPSSISTSNLTLSRGSVTGYTLVNSTTVTYSLSGLTSAGTLTVTIADGAITDTNGGAGASFTATYTLIATGLLSGLPAGSLVYETSAGGTLTTSGSFQEYTLAVATGQTITAVVVPGTLTNAEIFIENPHSGSENATATSPNQDVVLQTIATVAGTYKFFVLSSSRNTGTFTLEVFLNAAVSTSAIGGASNNQLSAAQSLAASFEATGPTASRAAVVGVTNGLSNGLLSDYYSFTMAAGQTVTLAVADQSGAAGTINVSLLNSNGTTVAAGTPMTTNVDGAVENFTATTAGTYYADVTGTTSNITYVLVVTRGADFDLKGNSTEATAQNISGTGGVLGAILSSAPTDWYAVNLAAGASLTLQTYTFGGTTANSQNFIDSVQPQIQFYSPSGALLASGTGSPNQSLVANATAAGTYYVEVTGGDATTGEYFLGISTALSASITPISPSPTNSAVSQMQIVFNGPVSGMSLADLSLSFNGGPNLLTSSQTLTTSDDKTFTLGNLASLTGANGVYTLTVAANSGITNQNSLSLQTGASTTFTVDTTPPEVTGVYVSGAAWSQTFLNYLASQGLGSAQLGYLIPGGANQLQDLPWVNITTVSVVFNESVSINTADSALQLTGSSGATFSYSGNTAQWTFTSPLATNEYQLSIPSADVTDALGSTLDGEWTTSSSTYPSGNGTAGGNFSFQFNILQADANRDGTVTMAQDGAGVRSLLLQNTTTGSYSPFYDLVGSGTITGIDGSYVRIKSGDTLPAVDPSVSGGGSGDVIPATDPGGTSAAAVSSGTTSDPSSSTNQPTGSTISPGVLAIGSPAGASPLVLGAPSSEPVGGSSWPTALQLITVPPANAAPTNAPTQATGSTSIAASSVSTTAMFGAAIDSALPQTTSSPIRSPLEANPIAPAEDGGARLSTVATWGTAAFASSAGVHGDRFVGDSNGALQVDLNNGAESSSGDWLIDLILEQELDWLDG